MTPVYDYIQRLVSAINPALDANVATMVILSFMAGNNQMELFAVHLPETGRGQRHEQRERMATVDTLVRMIRAA